MGSIKNGILGGVSGKVGNVIGFRRRGKDLLRVQAASISDARTPQQLQQRNKVAIVVDFVKPIMPFLRIGYHNYAQGRSAYNTAVSYLLKHCITRTETGESVLDYRRAMVSIGFLMPAQQAEFSCEEPGKGVFRWVDNSGLGNACEDDIAMTMIYNADRKEAIYRLEAGVRADEQSVLEFPHDWEGETLLPYLAFRSADREMTSAGVCLV